MTTPAPGTVAPVVGPITFDKSLYAPGDVITAKATVTPGQTTPVSSTPLTISATDPVTSLVGTIIGSFSVGSGPVSDGPPVMAASDPTSATLNPRKWAVTLAGGVVTATAVA
jgi:hypothetical protein